MRAPTSECCGGPSCRRSSLWPLVSGRCDTSRVFLKPRSWCSCPKPHRQFSSRLWEKDLLELVPLWEEDWFSANYVLKGKGTASMPSLLRLKPRAATWLTNAERVVGQALPTSTSGPFAVTTQELGMPLVSEILSVTHQGCGLLSGVGFGREVGGPASWFLNSVFLC